MHYDSSFIVEYARLTRLMASQGHGFVPSLHCCFKRPLVLRQVILVWIGISVGDIPPRQDLCFTFTRLFLFYCYNSTTKKFKKPTGSGPYHGSRRTTRASTTDGPQGLPAITLAPLNPIGAVLRPSSYLKARPSCLGPQPFNFSFVPACVRRVRHLAALRQAEDHRSSTLTLP